jgi:hypothetical protein
MTLAAYQDAFARMVLSPALCLRARSDGEAALAGFDLDAAERSRLLHIARQPGMRITCILARANRLSSLVGALPLTCELLKPELGAIIDRYWDEKPMADLQSLPAGLVFAQHLADEIAAGRITARFAADVLRYERARLELQLATHVHAADAGGGGSRGDAVRTLAFAFDPSPLFEALVAGEEAPAALPGTPTTVVLDFRGDPPETRFLQAA